MILSIVCFLLYFFKLLNALSMVGVPRAGGSEFSIVHGLRAAIQAMCECSEAQHEKRTALTENATKVNR